AARPEPDAAQAAVSRRARTEVAAVAPTEPSFQQLASRGLPSRNSRRSDERRRVQGSLRRAPERVVRQESAAPRDGLGEPVAVGIEGETAATRAQGVRAARGAVRGCCQLRGGMASDRERRVPGELGGMLAGLDATSGRKVFTLLLEMRCNSYCVFCA